MSLLDMVPDRVLGDMGGPNGEPSGREVDQRNVPTMPEAVGLDAGMAMGSAIKKLVQVSDKDIAKNNRLYLLVQVHHQREAKKHEVEQMANRPVKSQQCEGCGKTKALSMCTGELLCSTCASISGVLTKDPRSVAMRAIKREVAEALLGHLIEQQGGEWFTRQAQQYLPEEIKVDLGKGQLDAIANLVGYEGESSEELVEKVAEVMVENQQLWKDREDHGRDGLTALQNVTDRLVRREAALWELVGAMDEIVADREEVFKCYNQLFEVVQQERKEHSDFRVYLYRAITGTSLLPIPDDTRLVYLAAAGEALLEHIQRSAVKALNMDIKQGDIPSIINQMAGWGHVIREQTQFIVNVRDLLGMPVSSLGDLAATVQENITLVEEYRATIDRTVDDMTMAMRKQEEAEQQLLADEQIFAHLREVLEDDSLANGDLPGAVNNLVCRTTFGVLEQTEENHALNSRLLGLLLDFPEVGVERIAAIKEVA